MKTTRAAKLRELITSPELRFLVEAHDGLSARIAQEAGFEALWGSGLAISAACGVRDNNELSYTQVLDILEYMTDATSVPLLLDGDTGYGNFNNLRRLVKKLEALQVAGVCIEDKLFPKTNSFIDGEAQPLADVDEFTGKIKAGKDAQSDDDFCIVARVEALIAGWGLDEALRRAEAYHQAGADAILIHSKRATADEILSFKREWGDRCPVIIVPTTYYSTPTEVFRDAGFSAIIWANHSLRASIAAMQQTLGRLHAAESLIDVEERVVPVSEVFRLQGAAELKDAERKYLPSQVTNSGALLLAASRGEALGRLTEDRPKAAVRVAGKPLLNRMLASLNAVGVKDISVVAGYKKEALHRPSVTLIDNDDYASTKEVYSLYKGLRELGDREGRLIVAYGDVLCHKYVLMQLLESDADLCIAVDPDWQNSPNLDRYGDFVTCTPAYDRRALDRRAALVRMSNDAEGVQGEWMGIMLLSPTGIAALRAALEELGDEALRGYRMSQLLNDLVAKGSPVEVLYARGSWFDVDEVEDLVAAGEYQG